MLIKFRKYCNIIDPIHRQQIDIPYNRLIITPFGLVILWKCYFIGAGLAV
jgi:hypothetical protein